MPTNLIESRYYRSLGLFYFFDNSKEGEAFNIFTHFKVIKEMKNWDEIKDAPEWFRTYYTDKIKKS